MKRSSWLAVAVCLSLISPSFAQSHVSGGLMLGLQMHPSRSQATPVFGASAWLSSGKKFYSSAEYLFHEGIDRYPQATEALIVTRSHDESRLHRVAVGVHYPIKFHGQSSLTLLGVHFGQSWERHAYQYADISNVPFMYFDRRDYVRRSAFYASWTAMSQSRKMPFFLQARYGFSFKHGSLFEMRETKALFQVVAGLYLGII
jgi:hypothetical protein